RERREQRRGQAAGIDRALTGRVHAAVERRRQAGLQLPAAAWRQPFRAEPERALQLMDAAQLRRLVAVEGDVQGALARVVAAHVARRLELGDERRVCLRA